jgi:hypothetical protein
MSEPGGGLTCKLFVLSRITELTREGIIVNIFTWYTIELNLAICVACGPANLAFFRHHFPTFFDSSNTAGRYMSNGGRVYPLSNIQNGTRGTGGQRSHIGNKSFVQTTVTTNDPYFLENNSEEMIIPDSRIRRQVDVWVDHEDADVEGGKSQNGNSIHGVEVKEKE